LNFIRARRRGTTLDWLEFPAQDAGDTGIFLRLGYEMAGEKPAFKHLPLRGPGSIRVLYIEPLIEGGKGEEGEERERKEGEEEIVCYIAEVDLAEAGNVKYTALSYCWGDQSKKVPICLSDTNDLRPVDNLPLFWVTENLYDALVQLRRSHHQLPGDDRHALWIDAICINQEDFDERNEQVRRMGEIYEKATRINIWLGRAAENTSLAWSKMVQAIEKFVRKFQEESLYDALEFVGNHWNEIAGLFRTSCGEHDMEALSSMSDLLLRPWWIRAWIVQECSTENVDTMIWCGPYCAEWEDFVLAIHFCSMGLWRSAIENNIEHLRVPWRVGTDLFFVKMLRIYDGMAISIQLYLILGIMRGYEVSDPRDLVYASMAMINAEHPNLLVDYRKSVIDVWVNAAIFLIKELPWGHHLNILSWCEGRVTRGLSTRDELSFYEGLPSWVPDFRLSFEPESFIKNLGPFSPHTPPFYAAGLGSMWTSTSGSTADLRPKFADNCLVIYALAVGKVVDVQLPELVDNLEDIYLPTGESKVEAFLRLAVADGKLDGNGAVDGRGGSVIPLRERPRLARIHHEGHVERLIDGRQYVTIEGGYMGLVPQSMKVGDEIFMLTGGQVLYALRRNGNGSGERKAFSFLGEAYVHGLMDGEALQWLKEGKAELESIVIR
jgi:hypothetical protein